jgi:hypothetical protein
MKFLCADSSVAELPLFQGEDGGAIPTSALQLKFKTILSKTMNDIVVKNHYAHRAVPSSWSFGCFFNQNLLGVISFGKPASPHLCRGICGDENSSRVYELNRLWIDDACPKNSESRFISWSIRELSKIRPHLILVSYADTGANHNGAIYAATNWIYTGLSDRRVSGDKIVGNKHSRHSRTLENAVIVPRTRKHRFVYFCNPADKCLLKWEIANWSDMKNYKET